MATIGITVRVRKKKMRGLQKLFNHKEPQTVQEWLKYLKDNQYIRSYVVSSSKLVANTQPTTYSLTKLARRKLENILNM